MSFEKARELLQLADMARARHRGVSLREIEETFQVSHRTAQRMTRALEETFPASVDIVEDPDRVRRWQMTPTPIAEMRLSGSEELEALDIAIQRLSEPGDIRQQRALLSLRDRLMAAMPTNRARSAETDAEAMLESIGMAARPGPVTNVSSGIVEEISEALLGPYKLAITYAGTHRIVEPYGVLLGSRRYLVAKQPEKDDAFRHFRLDKIESAEVTQEMFSRDEGFSLAEHSARAFGSFHDEQQYGEVVWVFSQTVADRVASWMFHPDQTQHQLEDGRVEVRFRASGWLEMAWHLYQWGDHVEVVAPEALRTLVHPARRSDFNGFP